VDCTLDELICACISRQIDNGEVVAQGIATPLVAAGYLLAKCTHAPDLMFTSAIGQGLCYDWAPLGLAGVERLWLERSINAFGFGRVVTEVLPRYHLKEFFRPGQVDAAGNFNNIAIGGTYQRPRLRLPGSGGIPDVTPVTALTYIYVPRHSRAVFVPKLDYRSGLGHSSKRTRGDGPRYLVTNLGEFDFAHGHMRLTRIHPGVDIGNVRSKTGFELQLAPGLDETPSPTSEELSLLRNEIDPLGVRRLELLTGRARQVLLRDMLAQERALK
jgi:acyl CoA:acetate/3-ketoacid CoA transferase beta subunit